MLEKNAPILLVDDSLPMRQTVKNMLSQHSYTNVDTASNGVEAMEKIKSSIEGKALYRAIFLDWNMPGMDGLEFLKRCRIDMELKDVAIIMLTSVSDQKSVIAALGHGATSYITKPASTETILKKLDQIGNWVAEQGRKV